MSFWFLNVFGFFCRTPAYLTKLTRGIFPHRHRRRHKSASQSRTMFSTRPSVSIRQGIRDWTLLVETARSIRTRSDVIWTWPLTKLSWRRRQMLFWLPINVRKTSILHKKWAGVKIMLIPNEQLCLHLSLNKSDSYFIDLRTCDKSDSFERSDAAASRKESRSSSRETSRRRERRDSGPYLSMDGGNFFYKITFRGSKTWIEVESQKPVDWGRPFCTNINKIRNE